MSYKNKKSILVRDLNAIQVEVNDSIGFLSLFKHILWSFIFSPKFACVFCYRINRFLKVRKWPFYRILSVLRFYIFSNDIYAAASIGKGLRLVHLTDIVIGEYASVGENCTIFNGVTIGANPINGDYRMPKIGNNVFVGTGTKILGNVKIGDNVIIGAMTLCNRDVPSNSVAYGNPMQIKESQKIKNDPIWLFTRE